VRQRETVHPHGKRPKAMRLVDVAFYLTTQASFLSSAGSDIRVVGPLVNA
jgi:hypothetical protein